jgi:thiamine-phosphate pyrophosphorylase
MRPVTGLHVLIDPVRVPASRLAGFLRAVAAGGATVIQIRIKSGPVREALAYGDQVMALAEELGLTAIVNDRVDWALAIGAHGVHLGQDDCPVERARAIAPHLILGASAGTPDELARTLAGRPDYIGMGPVFATPSKADAGDAMGPEGFRALRETVPKTLPVIAIGGITPANARAVWAAGADGLAVIHAVAESPDPGAAASALVSCHPGPTGPSA